jgi:hypothetical protein
MTRYSNRKFVLKGINEKDDETGRNLYWLLDFGYVLKPEATRFTAWEAANLIHLDDSIFVRA